MDLRRAYHADGALTKNPSRKIRIVEVANNVEKSIISEPILGRSVGTFDTQAYAQSSPKGSSEDCEQIDHAAKEKCALSAAHICTFGGEGVSRLVSQIRTT